MMRSAWLSQEVLQTFNGTLAEVRLRPIHDQAGCFKVTLDTAPNQQVILWDRDALKRFPEAKELKQKLRDIVDPTLSLGHSDYSPEPPDTTATLETSGSPLETNSDTIVERGSARTAVARLFKLLRRGQMRRSLREAAGE